MASRTRVLMILALLSLLVFLPSSGRSQDHLQPTKDMQRQTPKTGGTVYVCACLKTKSCECMTEAKLEGPCACGTQGGPPLKPVPTDSAWAKTNREALAK